MNRTAQWKGEKNVYYLTKYLCLPYKHFILCISDLWHVKMLTKAAAQYAVRRLNKLWNRATESKGCMNSSAADIRRMCKDAVNEFCSSIRPLFFSVICVVSVLSTPHSTKWTLWPPVIFQPFDEGHWSTNKSSQWSAVYAEGPVPGPISPPFPQCAAGYVGTLMTGHSLQLGMRIENLLQQLHPPLRLRAQCPL